MCIYITRKSINGCMSDTNYHSIGNALEASYNQEHSLNDYRSNALIELSIDISLCKIIVIYMYIIVLY